MGHWDDYDAAHAQFSMLLDEYGLGETDELTQACSNAYACMVNEMDVAEDEAYVAFQDACGDFGIDPDEVMGYQT